MTGALVIPLQVRTGLANRKGSHSSQSTMVQIAAVQADVFYTHTECGALIPRSRFVPAVIRMNK